MLFYRHNLESSSCEPPVETLRIDRHQGVANMDQPHKNILQAVTAYKSSSRLQDAPHFAQYFVLQFGSGHMMQHGQRNSRRKPGVGKWHGGRIAGDHDDIAALKSGAQGFRQTRVNFQSGDARN